MNCFESFQSKQILIPANSGYYLQWDQREDPEGISSRSVFFRGSLNFDPEDPWPGRAIRPDSSVFGPETNALGFDSQGLSCGALAPGHIPQGLGSTGIARIPDEADRKRFDAADICPHPSVDVVKIASGIQAIAVRLTR